MHIKSNSPPNRYTANARIFSKDVPEKFLQTSLTHGLLCSSYVGNQVPCSENSACQSVIHLNRRAVHQPLCTVVQGRMCLQSEKPE